MFDYKLLLNLLHVFIYVGMHDEIKTTKKKDYGLANINVVVTASVLILQL